jgi:rubrerythrin
LQAADPETSARFAELTSKEAKAMNAPQEKIFWKCTKCGYTLTEAKPPEVCPECKQTCEFKNVTCYTPECGIGNIDPRL